jgi:two-component system, chemotaxis family, CheB/CheR fusion protein
LRASLTPLVGPYAVPFITFFPAVAAIAWFGGTGAGIMAMLVSGVTANYLWLEPAGRLVPETAGNAIALGFFFLGGTIINAVCYAFRRANRRAEHHAKLQAQWREEEARLRAAADTARTEAEVANRAKDHFIAVLSHELRTPLTAIQGWARMLRAGNLDEAKVAHGLKVIERNADVERRLIDDLLDVHRIATGQLTIEPRDVDLAEIVVSAAESHSLAATSRGVKVVVDQMGPVRLTADPHRLAQVVSNLLGNAIKFTPEGGVVTATVRDEGERGRIDVCDTGLGIPANEMPKIFDAFWQGASTLSQSRQGIGIGLSIVRHVVELHGGTVGVSSDGPGCGTCLTVVLPKPD